MQTAAEEIRAFLRHVLGQMMSCRNWL